MSLFNNNLSFRKKIKYSIAVLAITVSLGYLFVNYELSSWSTAISLTTKLFYHESQSFQVTVPHAQDTYQNLIKWQFGKDAKVALAVATAENGTHQCDRVHKNTNGTSDYGLFQVNSIHATKGNLTDCKDNVRVAYEIYKTSGWSPWVTFRNKSYLKYL